MKFLDQCKIYLRSGDGGDGVIGFRREKYIELGGPHGGTADAAATSCSRRRKTLTRDRLRHGAFPREKGLQRLRCGSDRRRSADVVVKVPIGTQVFAEDQETMLADLDRPACG